MRYRLATTTASTSVLVRYRWWVGGSYCLSAPHHQYHSFMVLRAACPHDSSGWGVVAARTQPPFLGRHGRPRAAAARQQPASAAWWSLPRPRGSCWLPGPRRAPPGWWCVTGLLLLLVVGGGRLVGGWCVSAGGRSSTAGGTARRTNNRGGGGARQRAEQHKQSNHQPNKARSHQCSSWSLPPNFRRKQASDGRSCRARPRSGARERLGAARALLHVLLCRPCLLSSIMNKSWLLGEETCSWLLLASRPRCY